MLDYIDTDQAIRKNIDDEDIIIIGELLKDPVSQTGLLKSELFNKDNLKTIYINESGFYTIIFKSKKDEAKKFRRWVTSEVLPSIRKYGSYSIINNYIEEDLDKYYGIDCVYVIHIKDDIYKYGNTSHLFKRLQAHKTNFDYKKIIKIYEMKNINDAIKLEKKIIKLTKSLNINIIYNLGNTNHKEMFKVNNNDLDNVIKKIDDFSLDINNKVLDYGNQLKIEELKTKQLELEYKTMQLKLELYKLSSIIP
jgi:predicted GIY-YIG superfamily endonuclease